MTSAYRNRLVTTISNAPGSAGAFTISTAQSGYTTFGAGDDGLTFDVVAVDGTAWEVRTGCVYTNTGTSLSRGTLEASSTGSAISLTSATVLTVTPTAAKLAALDAAAQGATPGGRLTLTSGTPVTTSDVTGATSVYYTPYIHNVINLWDGAYWRPVVFSEQTLALGTVTASLPYDVFGYLSGGTLALEKLAWTSGSARATAVTIQDGRYCKSGDKTRLYLGTFYTTATTTTEDSAAKRLLFNAYCRIQKPFSVVETTSSWTYGSAVWRAVNANTANRVQFMNGLQESLIDITAYEMTVGVSSGTYQHTGIGEDTTSANSANATIRYSSSSGDQLAIFAMLKKMPSLGFHYYQQVEYVETGAATFYGLDTTANRYSTGLMGECKC